MNICPIYNFNLLYISVNIDTTKLQSHEISYRHTTRCGEIPLDYKPLRIVVRAAGYRNVLFRFEITWDHGYRKSAIQLLFVSGQNCKSHAMCKGFDNCSVLWLCSNKRQKETLSNSDFDDSVQRNLLWMTFIAFDYNLRVEHNWFSDAYLTFILLNETRPFKKWYTLDSRYIAVKCDTMLHTSQLLRM